MHRGRLPAGHRASSLAVLLIRSINLMICLLVYYVSSNSSIVVIFVMALSTNNIYIVVRGYVILSSFRINVNNISELKSRNNLMSRDAELFLTTLPEQPVHLTKLAARDARMEQVKTRSELVDVEDRMEKLIMEQMYWQARLNAATTLLATEAALVTAEALQARIDRTALLTTIAQQLGMLATGKLTEVPADNCVERALKLVETPQEYPSDENLTAVLAS